MKNDFIVHLYERYGQTKDEFASSILKKAPYAKVLSSNGYQYEERSGVHKMPNVDFENFLSEQDFTRMIVESSAHYQNQNMRK